MFSQMMAEVLGLVVLLFVIFIWSFFAPKSKSQKFINKFPGPMKFPVIGNAWCLANSKDVLSTFNNLYCKYGNRVSLCGLRHNLILFHPEDLGKVLTSKEMNKSDAYTFFHDWLGDTVFIATAKEHLKKRKMLNPALDFKRVDDFELNCNEHSRILVQILATNESMGTITDMGDLLKICGLDISFQYFVGKSPGFLKHQDSKYASVIDQETKCINHRSMSPWLWPDMLWKMSPTGIKEKISRMWLHNYVEKVVQDRIKELNAKLPEMVEDGLSKQGKFKLLDMLIVKQYLGDYTITDKYIRDELNGFIFAAHDTTASSLMFTLFLLAMYPEEQNKVIQEVDDVFGKDKDRCVTYQDLTNLKYLEFCLKESLRLYPPATVLSRKTENDFQLDKSTTIPKGIEIMISPCVIHRLPEFWPEPEKFKPLRFHPENSVGRHPFSYIPFSAGSRNCIGQNVALPMEKTIIAYIFRNFRIELAHPDEKLIMSENFITHPMDGLKIKLQKR